MHNRTIFFSLILVLLFFFTLAGYPARYVEAGVFSRSAAKVAARKAAVRKAAQKSAQKKAAQRAEVEAKRLAAKKAIRLESTGKISTETKNKAIRAYDRARDRSITPKPLQRDKYVYRYTSRKQAAKEKTKGLAPNTHTTSKEIHPGRPLSPANAKRRYGLERAPEVRMTVIVPKGQPTRNAKTINGQAGYGELTSTRANPAKNIIKTLSITK